MLKPNKPTKTYLLDKLTGKPSCHVHPGGTVGVTVGVTECD